MRVGPSGKKFDDDWGELPDDTPVEIPVKMRQPRSMQEMVAMYVSNALALDRRMNNEEESVDVGEDMEVDDEADEILTPYELHAMSAEIEAHQRRKAWLDKNLRPRYNGGTADKGEPKNGRSEVGEGVAGAGQTGTEGKADGKPVAGSAPGDSEKAGSVAKPASG